MATVSADAPTDDAGHALQCMEIWGGNQAFDSAVSVPGIDAWVYSQPHGGDTSGGDIHYVSTCGRGQISRFVVADVSGHGQKVGELAARLRSMMAKHINKLDQTRFAQALSPEFSALSEAGTFATALLVSYFAPSDHLVLCNAGHPRPLWYRAGAGTWHLVEHTIPDCVEALRNLPLGIIPETSYYQFALPLERGDLLLMYTDSLTEAKGPGGELLGEAGLVRLVQGIDPSRPELFNRSLLEAVSHHRNHAPADDDVTVVLLHHNAGNPPRKSMLEMAKVLGKMVGLTKV